LALFSRRLAERLDRAAMAGQPVSANGVWSVAVVVFAVLSANAVVNQKRADSYRDLMYAFWAARDQVDSQLAKLAPGVGVLEDDDGIIGFALSSATMNATGLSMDREAIESFKRGRTLDIAYQRGFRVLSSLVYWSYLNPQRIDYVEPTTDEQIIESLVGPKGDAPAGADRFDFKVLCAMRMMGRTIYFLEFKPK